MSGLLSVRQALEVALNALTPALESAWENTAFVPKDGVPHQEVRMLPNVPDNTAIGGQYYREQGILQVELAYPLLKGSKDAQTRAEAIRTLFKRGTQLVKDGITVTIETTPAIGPGFVARDRWRVPVSVRYNAQIFS